MIDVARMERNRRKLLLAARRLQPPLLVPAALLMCHPLMMTGSVTAGTQLLTRNQR
jgi:hypothetical protein